MAAMTDEPAAPAKLPPKKAASAVRKKRTSVPSYDGNQIDTLHFRPAADDVWAHADFSPALSRSSRTFQNGVETNNSVSTGFPLSSQMHIGVTDDVSIDLGESYLFQSISHGTSDATGVTNGTVQQGFSDPTLGLDTRLLGGLSGTLFLDTVLSFSPTAGHQIAAGSSQNGNNLRGNTQISLSTALSGVEDLYEWRIMPVIAWRGSGNRDAQNTNNNAVIDGYLSGYLQGQIRYHISEITYFNLDLTIYPPYSYHMNFINMLGRTQDHRIQLYVEPTATFGILLSKNCVLGLALAYVSNTDNYTQTTNGNTNSYSSTMNSAEAILGISILL